MVTQITLVSNNNKAQILVDDVARKKYLQITLRSIEMHFFVRELNDDVIAVWQRAMSRFTRRP